MNIIYLRCSTEEQDPVNQLNDCMSLLNGDKFEVYQENESAFKDDFKRTEFKKVENLIKSRKIKKIAVWDIDRISRQGWRHISAFYELARVYDVEVWSFRQQFLNEVYKTPAPWGEIMFDFMLKMFAELAKDESKKKSDRVKIAYKNRKGKNWGRQKIQLNYFQVLMKYKELGSLRKTAEFFKVGKDTISKTLKSSEKSPLEKCNLFINGFAKKESLKKEQLKDK